MPAASQRPPTSRMLNIDYLYRREDQGIKGAQIRIYFQILVMAIENRELEFNANNVTWAQELVGNF